VTRIGLVVHGQPPELAGGTERLVAGLAAALVAAGETVEIFSGSIEWRPAFEVVRDVSGPAPLTRVHRHDLYFERWDKLPNPFVERAFLACTTGRGSRTRSCAAAAPPACPSRSRSTTSSRPARATTA
jgi:hypothetical protein